MTEAKTPADSSAPSVTATTQRISSPSKMAVKLLAIAFIAFFIGVAVGIGFAPRSQVVVLQTVTQTVSGPAVTQTPTVSPLVTPTASPPSTPVKYSFSGTGEKTTETFLIPTDYWKIQFKTSGKADPRNASLTLFVYPEDASRAFFTGASYDGYGEDHIMVYDGPGTYYLRIYSANCQWTITVTAPP
jgi:hypothetical protein